MMEPAALYLRLSQVMENGGGSLRAFPIRGSF